MFLVHACRVVYVGVDLSDVVEVTESSARESIVSMSLIVLLRARLTDVARARGENARVSLYPITAPQH